MYISVSKQTHYTLESMEHFQENKVDKMSFLSLNAYRSVGMPQLITVKVTNPSQTQNLHLNSISGESLVFHPSFFKSKVSSSPLHFLETSILLVYCMDGK